MSVWVWACLLAMVWTYWRMVIQARRSTKVKVATLVITSVILVILLIVLRGLSQLNVVFNIYDQFLPVETTRTPVIHTTLSRIASKFQNKKTHIPKLDHFYSTSTVQNIKPRSKVKITITKQLRNNDKQRKSKRSENEENIMAYDSRSGIQTESSNYFHKHVTSTINNELRNKQNMITDTPWPLPRKILKSTELKLNDRFASRRKHLLQLCTNYNISHSNGKNHKYILEPSSNILYCPVPKVATRFFFNMLYNLYMSIQYNRSSSFVLPPIASSITQKHNSDSEVKEFRKHSKAVIFVREPFGRLFSAYIDKLFSPGKEYLHVGMTMAMDREDGSMGSCGNDITFAEFIRYVIKNWRRNVDQMDPHYKPISRLCEPCTIKYDLIGKLETFSEDTDDIVHFVGAPTIESLQYMHKHADGYFLILNARNMLKDEQKLITCMTRREILMKFWRKKQITGVLNRTSVLPKRTMTNDEFIQLLSQAYEEGGSVESRRANRIEAMTEAYSTVPDSDIQILKRIYHLDFLLFGYTNTPDFIEKSRNYKSDFSYFKLDL